MKTLVVYREQTDYARDVETFMHDYTRQTGRGLEVINPDTLEGAQFCETYDLMEYPTIISIDDNGGALNVWRGLPLPTISEVSYYDQQA